jgi:gamma-glutamyltranspeptidase/glutathione hydrolase
MHTLSALMLGKDGRQPEMALGTSGGDFRPQQHVLFVTNILDYSMSLEDSLGYPRFLWTKDREVMIERGFEDEGLDFDKVPLNYPGKTGVAHGVEVSASGKKAVCDIRGEGIPMGDSSLRETLDNHFSLSK